MGALHFLSHDFSLQDSKKEGIRHGLELYENGGELFLCFRSGDRKITPAIVCKLTLDEARELANAADDLATRIIP